MSSILEPGGPNGISGLPESSRGALSMASRIAVIAMAAGSTIRELRLTGGRGGIWTRFGCRVAALGQNHLIAPNAPATRRMTISAPTTSLPQCRCISCHPDCVWVEVYVSHDRGARETDALGTEAHDDSGRL